MPPFLYKSGVSGGIYYTDMFFPDVRLLQQHSKHVNSTVVVNYTKESGIHQQQMNVKNNSKLTIHREES